MQFPYRRFPLAMPTMQALMAYVVSRRTQELGVRLALGATRWQVIGLVTRHGLVIAASGLAVGTVMAVGLGRLMEATLFGAVAPHIWQLPALVSLVALICAVASYLPARRTASLDPTVALRSE